MIAGELKSKIDRVWDAFWSGGISGPLEVIDQITCLLFIRRLDDLHTRREEGNPSGQAGRGRRLPIVEILRDVKKRALGPGVA